MNPDYKKAERATLRYNTWPNRSLIGVVIVAVADDQTSVTSCKAPWEDQTLVSGEEWIRGDTEHLKYFKHLSQTKECEPKQENRTFRSASTEELLNLP